MSEATHQEQQAIRRATQEEGRGIRQEKRVRHISSDLKRECEDVYEVMKRRRRLLVISDACSWFRRRLSMKRDEAKE